MIPYRIVLDPRSICIFCSICIYTIDTSRGERCYYQTCIAKSRHHRISIIWTHGMHDSTQAYLCLHQLPKCSLVWLGREGLGPCEGPEGVGCRPNWNEPPPAPWCLLGPPAVPRSGGRVGHKWAKHMGWGRAQARAHE